MAAAVQFEFDPAAHVYRVNGQPVPSVTQILEAAGITDYSAVPPDRLAYARELGTAVHTATEAYDQDDLDFESIQGTVVEQYLIQWRDFCRAAKFEPALIEHRGIGNLSGARYGFTVDRAGLMGGLPVVLDIKTGTRSRSWGIQLAAYEYALWQQDGRHRRRVVVQLDDESWKLHTMDGTSDLDIFRAALALETWKRNNS